MDGTISSVAESQHAVGVEANGTNEGLDFVNTYTAEGSTTFSGTKTIDTRALTDDDVFEFNVVEVDDEGDVVEGGIDETVANDVEGNIEYPTINYTIDDLVTEDGKFLESRDYHYRVTESKVDRDGLKSDERSYVVDVTIADDKAGKIVVDRSKNADALDFVNTYSTEGQITLSGTKKLQNRLLRKGEFSFTLTATDAKGKALKGDAAYTETVANEADGSYAFSTLSFTGADMNKDKAGHFKQTKKHYTVKEELGSIDGVTYDEKVYDVTVTLTDDGKGALIVEADPAQNAYDFTNVYETNKPTFQKKIQDVNDTTGEKSAWQDSADYDINDAVPYRLTAKLAKDVTEYRQYHITFWDRMEESLDFASVSKVTVNGEEVKDYVLNASDHAFDLTLTWGDGKDLIDDQSLNEAEVEVYFTATLNEKAQLGKPGNVNQAQLEYSCNPLTDETAWLDWDYVIAFTYKLDVSKLTPDGIALQGAEFELHKQLADGTTKPVELAVEGNVFTGIGLDDGTYVLTETSAPKGYQPIDPVTFTVTATHESAWEERNQTGEIPQTRTKVLTDLTGEAEDGALTFATEKDLAALTTDATDQEVRDLSLAKRLDKTIADSEDALATEFSFTVALSDVPAWFVGAKAKSFEVQTMTAAGGEETPGTATFKKSGKTWTTTATLKANQTITYVGLPKGTKYTVSEAAEGHYGVVDVIVDGKDATAVKDGAITGSVTGALEGEDGTVPSVVEFINASVSSLQVSKVNDFSGLDLTEEEKQAILHSIAFTVSGPDGFSESHRMDESDYFIEDEETGSYIWTLTDLKPGEYTVSESRDEVAEGGYANKAEFEGDAESARTYQLDGTAPAKAAVINSFANVDRNAKVSVTKEVLGDDFEKDEEFTFELAKATGKYASDEDQLTGNTTVSVQRDEDGYTVEEFGSIAYMTNEGSFYYTITEVEPEEKTVGMTYDTTPTWVRVDLTSEGTEVHYGTEKQVTSGGGEELDLAAGITKSNTYKQPGSLRVTKHVEGLDDEDALTDEEKAKISFTVTGPDGFKQTKTLAEFEDEGEDGDPAWLLEDLVAGDYTVTETGADVRSRSWALTTTYSVDGEEGEEPPVVTVADGETAEVEVTNDYDRAHSIRITKVVSGLTLTDEEKAEIEFVVTGPNDFEESRTLDEFDKTDADGNPVWIIYEDSDGEALADGTYTVVETGGELFERDGVEYQRTTTYEVGETTSTKSAKFEVTGGGAARAKVTNAYDTDRGAAVLRVAKAFEGDYQGDEKFTFVLRDEEGEELGRVQAANGETADFDVIHYAADEAGETLYYTITEVVPDEPTPGITYNTEPVWASVELDESLHATVCYGTEDEVMDGEAEEADHATVTNKVGVPEAEAGAITVRKVVSSTRAEDKQRDFAFRVTLLDSDGKVAKKIAGTYGDMKFTDGVAEFTLRDGGAATARDLPFAPFDSDGKPRYKVEEIDAGGLESSSSEEKNGAGNGTTVTYTNTYKPDTPQEQKGSTGTAGRTSAGSTRTNTPRTGDPTTYLPLIALVIVGIVVIVVGTRRRK